MTTLSDLSAFVNDYLSEKKMVKTSLEATAFRKALYDGSKSQGGAEWKFPVRNSAGTNTAKMFRPTEATDYVGVTPGSNNYQDVVPVVDATCSWAFLTGNLKYSEVQMQQYSTSEQQLSDYLGDRLEFVLDDMEQLYSNQLISGTGNGYAGTLPSVTGTVAQDMYGLQYQQRYYSGITNANTNNEATNTHFGLARHLYPELVCNSFDATTGYGTTVTQLAKTLTNGNTEIPGLTSAAYAANKGWEIWFRPAGVGSYVRMGREYVVADTAAGAATTLQMSQVFRGVTGSYDIQLVAPYNTTTHGAAGAFNLAKIEKAYARASNGNKRVTHIACNSETFVGFLNYLQGLKRWTKTEDSTLSKMGYENFKFNQATVIVDDHEVDGVLRGCNTSYTKLRRLKGMSDFKKIKIRELPSETGILQYGGAAVVASQVECRSPRSEFVVSGITL